MKAREMEVKGDLRPMVCEQDILQRPDGSAMFNQGDSSVMVAVYGPAEVKISKESIQGATLEVVYKPKVGLPSCADRLPEQLIRNTCKNILLSALHPRTSITFILQEMQNSGSMLSCCINGACMAALDASLPMKYSVAAVTCCIDSDGQVILDPDTKTETSATAVMTLAFSTTDYAVISSVANGIFKDSEYKECVSICREAAKKIADFYRGAIKQRADKANS